MIGVDTNVLVRIFVDDNPEQRAAAQAFMRLRSADDPAFVSVVVVAEVSWVLTRMYKFSIATVRDTLDWLFESTNVIVEDQDLVKSAVAQAADSGADISDCIIAAIAAEAGSSVTVTFDKIAAKRIPGMDLLA